MLGKLARLLALTTAVMLPARAPAQVPPLPPAPSKGPVSDAADTIRQMMADLREAHRMAAAIPDLNSRRRMEQLLDEVELKARRLGDLTATVLPRVPLARPDFDKLLASLKKEAFDEGRFSVLKLAGDQAWFTSDQAKTIVSAFIFATGQKKAAIFLHPRLTDPVNFHTVVAVMPFDSDRKEVMKAVAKP